MIEKTNPWVNGSGQGEVTALNALEQAEFIFGKNNKQAIAEWMQGFAAGVKRFADIAAPWLEEEK